MEKNLGIIFAFLTGILWGTNGLFSRNLLSNGFSSIYIVLIRVTGAAIITGLIMLIKDINLFKISKKDIVHFLGFGIFGSTIHFILYFNAIKNTTLATTTILTYTNPVYTTFLAAYFFKEKINKEKILGLILVISGCFLVVGGYQQQNLDMNFSGTAYGLGAGLSAAIATLFAKKLSNDYKPLTTAFYSLASGSILFIILISYFKVDLLFQVSDISIYNMVSLIYLVLGPTVIAYVLFLRAMEKVEASKVTICTMIEVIVTVLIGYLAFKELLNITQICGGLLVMTGVIVFNKLASTKQLKSENQVFD